GATRGASGAWTGTGRGRRRCGTRPERQPSPGLGLAHAEPLEARSEPRSIRAHAEPRRTRSFWGGQGEGEGGGEGGLLRFLGAAETARRIQGSCDLVVRSGRVSVRGVEPASPGMLSGGMSLDPTGTNHMQHEHGSGRGSLGSTTNAARPGTDSALSAAPREKKLRGSV